MRKVIYYGGKIKNLFKKIKQSTHNLVLIDKVSFHFLIIL